MRSVYEKWLGDMPLISNSDITEFLETDVIVVGGGLAGVTAARQAAEMGAKVVLFEKCKTIQARGGDFAILDSKIADRWNRRNIDKVQIVTNLLKDMCYMVNQNIYKKWAENAGSTFDWYMEGYPEAVVLNTTHEAPPKNCKCWLQPRRFPLPETFDNSRERFKCYQTTVWIRPSHIPVLKGNYNLADATDNLTSFFSCPVCKLLREDGGRVFGVVAKNREGKHIKATAKKGVILATGDYMSNKEMLYRFCPGYINTPQLWTSYDENGCPSNTGDGHKLGMWIGAKLQSAPHAVCAHHMGSVFGASCFLLLDTRGMRFINEDAPGQEIGNQIENLPDKTAWQFVDGNWREHIPKVYPNHGSVCYVAENEDLKSGKIYSKLSTIDNYITPELIDKAVQGGKLLKADTLEGLIEKTDLPKETALKSIKRYNELCKNKKDVDYGKNPIRLFDVSKPPFYAAEFKPATMIAVMGGLQSDEEAHSYDEQGRIIPGLYLAGNVQGNRFAVEYPLTVPGLSHSMAITFGRIAGKNVVEEV